MPNTDLHPALARIASNKSTFRRAQRSGDGDMMQKLVLPGALLIQSVADRLCGIDGTTTAHGDDGVDVLVREDHLSGLVQLFDRSMLSDFAVRLCMVFRAQLLFDLLDEIGFRGKGIACDDEGFGGFAGKAFE